MSKYMPVIFKKLIALVFALIVFGNSAAVADEYCPDSSAQTEYHSVLVDASYTVKKGDTLYNISLEHQIQVRELMRANDLSVSLINPGDVLTLPEKSLASGNLSRGGISREDLMLLARLIHAEARGESFEGQVAVGAVIMNRLSSPQYPDTIQEIIYQNCNLVYQFSPVDDGSINLYPDEKAVRAAVQALSGKDPTGGALFFYNPEISGDTWIRTLPVVTRIGNHVFATASKVMGRET